MHRTWQYQSVLTKRDSTLKHILMNEISSQFLAQCPLISKSPITGISVTQEAHNHNPQPHCYRANPWISYQKKMYFIGKLIRIWKMRTGLDLVCNENPALIRSVCIDAEIGRAMIPSCILKHGSPNHICKFAIHFKMI